MSDNSFECIVFDLDGTLVKSHTNIYKATIHSFNELKIEASLPEEKFYSRIGHHFEDIFNEFGIEVKNFEEFIKVYKSVYFDYIDSSTLYPYVEKTIATIKSNSHKTALLTTKGQEQADRIIDHFGLRDNFDYVMGRRPGLAHKPSPEPLLKICDDLSVNPSNVLMVGDTEMDIRCGKNAGSKTCAVTYGYRTIEQIKEENPDYIIENIDEISDIV